MLKSKLSPLFVIFALFLLDANLALAVPTATEYGTIINLSGRQRMLTQKMTKELLFVSLDFKKSENLKNLRNTASLFEKTFLGLRDGDASVGLPATESRRIKRQLKKVEKLWKDYNALLQQVIASSSISKAQVGVAAKLNLPLLKEMNKAVKLYESAASKAGLKSNPSLAVSLNLSGKQRMLTQKMSKEFLLIATGHEVADNQLNLLETYNLFDRTLKGLKDGDQTLDLLATKETKIRNQLDIVARLWSDLKPLMQRVASTGNVSVSDISLVSKKNLPLLKQMNAAVKMYEKLASN